MAKKKIYLGDELFGLGALSYPTLTFTERDEILQQSQPGMTPQERAAVTYFAMLAETPAPTASGTYNSIEYEVLEANTPYNEWPKYEEQTKYSAFPAVGFTQRTLQESYAISLYHLQQWLVKNNLWTGIEKTLAEESRKRQEIKAALDAQAAAAAKSLAMKRITEEEAVEVEERVEKEQAEIDRQLAEIKAGILPKETTAAASGSSSILPLAAAAAAAFFALKG